MANNRYAVIMGAIADSETIHLTLRPAWRSFWKGFVTFFLVMAFSIAVDLFTAGLVLSVIIFVIIVVLRYRVLYTVTSKRVIVCVGLIARNTREVEIRHTRELQVRQGIIERLLNYGAVEVTTAAGTGPAVIFTAIVYPHDLKEAIRHVRNGL